MKRAEGPGEGRQHAAGTFGALHVLPRLLVRPVVRLLYQMLDQGLIPERADAFLRAILPRLQPSAPA